MRTRAIDISEYRWRLMSPKAAVTRVPFVELVSYVKNIKI